MLPRFLVNYASGRFRSDTLRDFWRAVCLQERETVLQQRTNYSSFDFEMPLSSNQI